MRPREVVSNRRASLQLAGRLAKEARSELRAGPEMHSGPT